MLFDGLIYQVGFVEKPSGVIVNIAYKVNHDESLTCVNLEKFEVFVSHPRFLRDEQQKQAPSSMGITAFGW